MLYYYYYPLVLCCLCVIWRLWSKEESSEPPELSGWLPLIGHAHKLMGDGVNFFNTLVAMSEECLKKGGVTTLHFGPRKIYAVADPDDCLTVMNACLEKSNLFKFAKPFLGNGLIIADVERWQTSRKLLNPAFNQKVLDGFIEIFNKQAQDLVDKFGNEMGKPFDQEKLLRINNLETICSTSFEVPVNEYRHILKRYLPLLVNTIKSVNNRIQKFWLHSDFIYNMTQEKKLFDEDVKGLIAVTNTIIQSKKTERQTKPNIKSIAGKPKKFIDLILDLAEETGSFTDEQIREESDSVVVGGHDTTASTLTFALALLGSHTDVQDKLYEEILRVCGDSECIDKDHLSKLVYADAVLKETLRLYPIAFILSRYIERDVKLKNYTIKGNYDCFVMVHGLHRHSIWGPDADLFRPERWLDKETLPDPKYYGAFGLGRRSCIGKAYAMMSMKTTLAVLLRRYRVSSDVSKMAVSLQVMSRPESGYFITVKQREQLA